MRKKLMLTVMVCAIALKSLATDPGWSVTPSSFNFDMTITAVLEDNCNALENPSNRLGAFGVTILDMEAARRKYEKSIKCRPWS